MSDTRMSDTLTEAEIAEVLEDFAKVAQIGRRARTQHGPCDAMYDKGWDDCLDGVRSWLRLAARRP